MNKPCEYEGICRKDCPNRNDTCDGNWELMTDREKLSMKEADMLEWW
jgi:hypothetical protein